MISIDDPPVTTVVVDGTPYAVESFGEAQARDLPFLVVTPEALAERKAYGFSTEAAMETWLADQSYLRDYQHLRALRERAMRPLDAAEEERIRGIQASDAEEALSRYAAGLERHGVSPDDPEAISTLLRNYDPLLGPPSNTAYLFDRVNFQAPPHRVLQNGRAYRHLGWIAFDDVTSSVRAVGAVALYAEPHFGGRCLPLFNVAVSNLGVSPYYFNNQASSAIIG